MSVSLRKATDSAKPEIWQCEGCYGPLGDFLDRNPDMGMDAYNIHWFLCPEHDQPISNVPFDVYDDYDDGYNGGCSGVF